MKCKKGKQQGRLTKMVIGSSATELKKHQQDWLAGEKTQITNSNNEREVISIGPSDIKQIIKEYYEQLRSINLTTQKK